ncbi:MATE family efflux transporter [Spirochaetia bacterium]|nr:MATE family efflux transporter [Spirochaetia bacterium]
MTQEINGPNPLGYAPVVGLIRKYAVPAIVSMLVTAAYNITDQIFIGRVVGMLGNAATNIAFPVTIFCTACALLIGAGTATNFNIKLGAKQSGEAALFAGMGVTIAGVLGLVVFLLIFLFETPILLVCGASENVLPYASLYLGITVFGLPFLLFSSVSSYLIRADGSPMYSMVAVAVGAVLNVFLDWLFMILLPWGIRGAAVATIIGQIVSCVLCLAYLPRFKSVPLKLTFPRWIYLKNILKLGLTNFTNHIVMMTVNIVLNNTLKHYGALSVYGPDIPLAVAAVIAKLNTILLSFAVGLAQGCQPILGFNIGAKNYVRVKETYKKAATVTLAISVLFFLSFQIFPLQIVSIFGGGSDQYFDFAKRYMRIYMFMVFMFGIQPLTVNYFTATGKAKQGIILSLSRQGFILIPLLIIMPVLFGIDGVLYAGPIADALAVLLSLSWVRRDFKRLNTAIAGNANGRVDDGV